ncbi:MAG: hypothetical protein HY819_03670, partial [Acidobacteria bacterium]|nr:hypothetical protein [Acidobacteriota bacterium]
EQEKLQGIWNAVSVEKGNQIRQVQPNELAQFIIENNKIKIKDSTIRKKTETELLYEIDLSKNPKTMFLKDTEALNNSTYATYSLEGDILIIEVKNYFEDGREKIVFTLRKTKP